MTNPNYTSESFQREFSPVTIFVSEFIGKFHYHPYEIKARFIGDVNIPEAFASLN